MQAVLASFQLYFIVYLVALVLAPPLYWFGKDRIYRGIGLGLVIFASTGLVIDYFASARARVYTGAIEQLELVAPDAKTTAEQPENSAEASRSPARATANP